MSPDPFIYLMVIHILDTLIDMCEIAVFKMQLEFPYRGNDKWKTTGKCRYDEMSYDDIRSIAIINSSLQEKTSVKGKISTV